MAGQHAKPDNRGISAKFLGFNKRHPQAPSCSRPAPTWASFCEPVGWQPAPALAEVSSTCSCGPRLAHRSRRLGRRAPVNARGVERGASAPRALAPRLSCVRGSAARALLGLPRQASCSFFDLDHRRLRSHRLPHGGGDWRIGLVGDCYLCSGITAFTTLSSGKPSLTQRSRSLSARSLWSRQGTATAKIKQPPG